MTIISEISWFQYISFSESLSVANRTNVRCQPHDYSLLSLPPSKLGGPQDMLYIIIDYSYADDTATAAAEVVCVGATMHALLLQSIYACSVQFS